MHLCYGVEKMTRLESKRKGGITAPLWSWMGHTGGISFIKPDPHTVEWLVNEVTLPWTDKKGPRPETTSYRGEVGLKGIARDFRIPESGNEVHKADIIFDDPDMPGGRKLKCMVIGRKIMQERTIDNVRNYVLIIMQKVSTGRQDVYERVGAGFLQGSLIDFSGPTLHVLAE